MKSFFLVVGAMLVGLSASSAPALVNENLAMSCDGGSIQVVAKTAPSDPAKRGLYLVLPGQSVRPLKTPTLNVSLMHFVFRSVDRSFVLELHLPVANKVKLTDGKYLASATSRRAAIACDVFASHLPALPPYSLPTVPGGPSPVEPQCPAGTTYSCDYTGCGCFSTSRGSPGGGVF